MADQVFQIKVLGRTTLAAIPPFIRTSHRGKRENALKPIFDFLKTAEPNDVLIIKHNSPSAQILHGRLHQRLVEQGLDMKVHAAVRGDKAYIWHD